MNIIILAAGQGKRMNSKNPKVLQPLGGKPLLFHVLETAQQLIPEKLIVVCGHQKEMVIEAIQKNFRTAPHSLSFAQQSQQLGTGHAVAQAMPFVLKESSENFGFITDITTNVTLILYGDVPLIRTETLQAVLNVQQANQGVCILTTILDDPIGYGRIIRDIQTQNILGIIEQKDATAEQLTIQEVNTGIIAFPTSWLWENLPKLTNKNAQGEYYLTDLIELAVNNKIPVNTYCTKDQWETFGVNDRLQLTELECIYQKLQVTNLLKQGVHILDQHRLDIRGTIHAGQDVSIDVGCILTGKIILGNDVKIGAYCVLENVQIASGTIIEPFSHLKDCVIGEHTQIGPFARIRPQTYVGDNCKVGNFVEIKKTTLGNGSKANHLSYLGDAIIGQNVNIGAGVITCNYDGVNKFNTIVEDDVFIGSDCQLIAPITIEKGATIGAGTTLTKLAPENQLTLSRSEQKTIKYWKRPVKKNE
jgi:bifunctional UDP-N-acetylglucosamine pyrophosphorylase/glucosamine-1-phosphate N-acetyltransferase